MSVTEKPATRTTEAVEPERVGRSPRLLTVVALIAIIVGAGSVLGGIGGAAFTYQQAAVENIITPGDAAIAEAPVRGPFTMWAQSDIITQHQLDRTDGLRYAEMDRMVPQIEEATGEVVLDADGDPVMVENLTRLSWIDATSLTTVLNMGIMAYALSAFAMAVGATLLLLGVVVWRLRSAVLF